MSESPDLNRREFAKKLAAAAVVVPLVELPGAGVAAEEKKTEKKERPSTADLFLELIQQQYPDERLDAAALAEIRHDLEEQLARSRKLSAFPLTNADEPGFGFAAYRRD